MNPTIQIVEKTEDQANKEEHEKMVTIAGGIELDVYHLDGSTERVKVRQIPATKLEAFMTKLADEATSVSIYCDKPPGWADTLTQESITEICEKGLQINQNFLHAWCRRRAKWTEMLNVGVVADLQKRLEALQDVLASVTSAQKLPISTDSAPRR